ncbi:MAG: hypothetical protein KBA23_11545 [Amaricoccus sp.]|nr:hypothetical protein [Amaricoccus sp.]
MLLLCLLAVRAGAETVTDIARFGAAKRAPLRRFAAGTPAHDHPGDILCPRSITDASRPVPSPSSTTLHGSTAATAGPA